MARPFKEALDYFPLDVDYLKNKKVQLIKAEFGDQGVIILLELWSTIYRNNGYYYKWDEDDYYLTSIGVGSDCKPSNVREVLKGCIRRFLFDEEVFNTFGVLTSKGVQKRYVNAITERKNITLIKEYWLIDLSQEKRLTSSILNKITFNSINPPINPINPPINSDKPPINSESKVKESKEKKSKEYICGTSPPTQKFIPPTIEEVQSYCSERRNNVDPIKWHDFYSAKGWMIGKNKMKDWKGAVRTWERGSSYAGNIGSSGKTQATKYDTSKLVNTPTPGITGNEQVDF